MKNENSRIFGLDILRATAIICVLVAHTITYTGKSHFLFSISAISGLVGVELFFVLSGFLIGIILIKMHNQEVVTSTHSIKVFWIRRWFRTLPNYYLTFIISGLLIFYYQKIFIFNRLYELSFIVFLQNFFTFKFSTSFFAVSWSLAVEEWFYILFPLVLFLSQFIFSNKKKSFLFVTLIFITFPLILKIFFVSLNYYIPWEAGFRKIVPLRLDAIGFGVLLAYIKFYKESFLKKNKNILSIIGVLLFSVLIFLYYNLQILSYDFANETEFNDCGFFMKTFFFTLLSLSIALLIPVMYDVKVKKTNNYMYKLINIISLSSYSIYLFHMFYIMFLSAIYVKLNLKIDFLWVILVWVITIIFSYLQYSLFEVKFTALRDKFGTKKDAIGVYTN